MDSWEKDTSKKLSESRNSKFEKKETNNLIISNRQLSFVVSGGITTIFFAFIGGYFWGQHYAIEQLSDKLHSESLADQMYASLFSLGERQQTTIKTDTICDSNDSQPHTVEAYEHNKAVVIAQKDNALLESFVSIPTEENTDIATNIFDTQKQYYSQLSGFGVLKSAERFADRLGKKGHVVEVKKRTSKTSRGKKIVWYQVVTQKYSNKNDLEALVKKLSQEEKLSDPRIVVC